MPTKYILIQNDGEIESNSFELIGASTKRGESGKIGFFGSGLKYSIAYMMRKEIEFRVFSGRRELSFTTKSEHLKEQSFQRICIDGVQTSYTTTMGPTWTEDWFVLREIYCNAIDETNCLIVKDTETVQPSEGKTRIYIELTETLKKVIENWDRYFTDERTPLFSCERIYTSGLGTSDGQDGNYQPVKVYHKTEGVIYRRGIAVGTNKSYLYDYELAHVDINEDRTAKQISSFDYGIVDMMGQLCDESWLKSILRTGNESIHCSEYSAMTWDKPSQIPSEKWVEFSKENMLVVREISGRYSEEMAKTKKEVFLIPASFAKCIKTKVPGVVITGMGNVIGDGFFTEVDRTPKMDFLLKEVLASLNEMKYEVPFDIYVAEFDDDNIMGQADIPNKKIFIAKGTFDMGRREIAMTIMEETEHIKSGKHDETRAFQTHIFSQWLKTMEDSNGLFL